MPSASERPLDRRTFTLGVVNGFLFNASGRLVDATVVISVLAQRLIESQTLVGLLLVALHIGWNWPSLFMPYLLEGRPRKMNWYRWTAILRSLAILSSVVVLFSGLPTSSPRLAFWLITVGVFLQTSFGGVSWIPFMDVVAKAVPVDRRGLFWSLRQGIAAVLGIGASYLVLYMLDPARGYGFPRGYAWLFALSAAAQIVAMALFCFATEPEGTPRRRRMTLRMHMVRGPRLLRTDPVFRTFSVVRIVISLAPMGIPFLALYGQKRFGLADADTAALLLPVTVVSALLPFLWGQLSDRYGSRVIVRVSAVLSIATAGIPLLVWALWHGGLESRIFVQVGLGAALALGYAATSSWVIAVQTFILEIAPDAKRDTYVGFNSILATPLAFSSLLAGAIADAVSLEALYAVCLGLSVVGAVLAFAVLPEPRAEALPGAAARALTNGVGSYSGDDAPPRVRPSATRRRAHKA